MNSPVRMHKNSSRTSLKSMNQSIESLKEAKLDRRVFTKAKGSIKLVATPIGNSSSMVEFNNQAMGTI